jgi:hypothetical protein
MKDVVRVTIAAPVANVAHVFANPEASGEWMDGVDYQPISGTPGMPGSKYRLVSKELNFTVTVVKRDLPKEFVMSLDDPAVHVLVTGRFAQLPGGRTKLTSEEVFTFKDSKRRAFSFLAWPAIHKVHKEQMVAFKRYMEGWW